MRRGSGALLALLAVGVLLLPAAGCGARHSTGAGARPATPASPVLGGSGPEAAAVAGGQLFLIRGNARMGVPAAGPLPGTVSAPAWSHDGAWLAYDVGGPGNGGPGDGGTVHMVRADGTGDHALAGVTSPFAWSPAADLLAYADAHVTLTAVDPTGTARPLVGAGTGRIYSFAWSQDGGEVAYAVGSSGGADQLFSVSVDGGHFTRWPVSLPAGTGLLLAGWWPAGAGILAWQDPLHSASLAADGVPLMSIDPTGAATTLATTLPDPRGIAWAPGGQQFAVAVGGDREPWSPRTLDVCSAPPRPSCRALPQPPGTTSVEPAWAPAGRIAFVRAPARGEASVGATPAVGPNPAASMAAWYSSRQLWVEAPDGSAAREVTGGGVSAPAWAAGGDTIVYSTATGVGSVAADGGGAAPASQDIPVPSASPDIDAIVGKQPWDTVAVWAPEPSV